MYQTVDRIIPKLKKDIHYNVDEKSFSATLTEEGVETVERNLKIDNLYEPGNIILLHHVTNALKAHTLYRRDVNYLVKDGEVRHHRRAHRPPDARSPLVRWPAPGRRGQRGRGHPEPRTTPSPPISFQNYFRLYKKLSA
jgi:preprotein translocase subunit SecA